MKSVARLICRSLVVGGVSLLAAAGCSKAPSGTAPSASATAAAPAKQIVVGFSQVGAESGWRTANTESIQSEAKKRGIDLKFSDAQGQQENQIAALRTFAEEHVNVILFSPVVDTGWTPILTQIKKDGIPVVIEDRRADVSDTLYDTFIGSDFVDEGRSVGEWLAKHTDGKAVIAELDGTPGSAPANDRRKGFEEAISKYPDMKVVWEQSGDFTREGGKQAFEAFLKTPESKKVTALFSHNDDMAMGAIQAMEAAGIRPGKDIKIVSIDGIHDALEAILAGKLNCCRECSPLLGPKVFDAIEDIMAGKPVQKRVVVKEELFDASNVTPAVIAARKY